MEGLRLKKDTKRNALWGGVSRLGTLFGVATMLVFGTGCPQIFGGGGGGGTAGPECTADNVATACTAGTGCQTASCSADGACVYTDDCDADHCVNDACVACVADSECEDNNGCTDDACTDNACVNTNNTAGCDDGNACTDGDACDGGTCGGTAIEGCCEADADCDDGAFCNGAETCDTAAMTCTAGTDPCSASEVCNEDTDACETVSCDTDADCDDGDPCTDDLCVSNVCENSATDCDDGVFCNGAETCDPNSGCVAGTAPCDPDTEQCDEDNDVCQASCAADADCLDDLFCNGTEVCGADGFCQAGADPCPDDGLFCTGDEGCDEDTDSCTASGNPCAADESCNDNTDACETAVACTTDAECDDGLFCTGTNTCSADGFCTSTGDPCTAEQTCNEDLNQCDNPPGVTVDFTLEPDNLSGTGGDDTFSGPLLFNPPTGTSVPSIQTADTANGGDGVDSLDGQFNFGAATTVSPTLSGIETLNLTDFGTAATTLSGTNITGVSAINLTGSTNGNVFTVNNLPSLADVGISQQGIGATFGFQTAASSGSSDSATMTFNGMTAGTVTYTTGTTNGIETLNIVSNTNGSTVADIAMNGATLTTVNISGDADFTHTASLDGNVTTVDGSTATGDLNITQTNAGNFTFTGGAGDDTIILGSTYGTTDTLDGGAGTDVLGGTTAVIGGTTSTQSNVSNFETLRVSDAHTTAINVSHFGSIGEVVLDVGSNGGSITNASTGFNLTCGTRAGTAAGAGTLAATISGSGTSDTLTFTLNDAEQAGAVTFTGVETLNLVSNLDLDGSAANTGTAGQNTLASTLILTDTAALEKVVVTGSEQMNVTGSITANEVDASGMSQAFVMGATMTNTGVTVTGGSAGDTLFGSAGNDIINGGAGNDTLNALAGNDIVSGGAGADTFRQSAAAANGVDRQTISDFDDTVTTGDVFNFNSGVATLTGTNNFASSAAIQTHSTSGNLTVNAAAEVVIVTSGTTANLLTSGAANVLNGTDLLTAIGGTITGAIAGQNDILIGVADANGNVGIYYASSADNSIINTEITLVAILQGSNVTLADMIFNNFSNGA